MASASAKMPRRLCFWVCQTGRLDIQRLRMRRHRLCRRQAALHGASGAPRSQMECPQRHRATNHRLMNWCVTELYGAQWHRRRRRCREDRVLCADRPTGSSETQSVPKPPMSAPGVLARRFWDDASANLMSATSLRKHSPPNSLARHRGLRPQWLHR